MMECLNACLALAANLNPDLSQPEPCTDNPDHHHNPISRPQPDPNSDPNPSPYPRGLTVQARGAAEAELADARAELTAVVGDLAEAEARADSYAAAAAHAEAALAERDTQVIRGGRITLGSRAAVGMCSTRSAARNVAPSTATAIRSC